MSIDFLNLISTFFFTFATFNILKQVYIIYFYGSRNYDRIQASYFFVIIRQHYGKK